MAQYVHPEVEALLDGVAEGGRTTVVVVPDSDRDSQVRAYLEDLDAEIEREIPLGMFLVRASVSALEELVEHPDVQAVHPDEEGEVLTSGNSSLPP